MRRPKRRVSRLKLALVFVLVAGSAAMLSPFYNSRASLPPQGTKVEQPTQVLPRDAYLVERYNIADKTDNTGAFGWKDVAAAKRFGMDVGHYVIGGLDPSLRDDLYRASQALDAAGHKMCFTSGFRDPTRQKDITTGVRAKGDKSYHGGNGPSKRGHGYAVAIDVVACGAYGERHARSERIWRWIDIHGQTYNLVRPYREGDPPHVAPYMGGEHRGQIAKAEAAKKKKAEAKTETKAKKKKKASKKRKKKRTATAK